MIKLMNKLALSTMLFFGLAMNSHAGVINYTPPNVNNYASTDALVNWFSTGNIGAGIDSFTLSFNWKDQGWGNRKGRIYFSNGASGWQNLGLLAEHYWTAESVTISSSDFNFDFAPLNFAYVVGGGGGHSLHIKNASLDVTTVPEPASLALLGLGLVGLGYSRRHQRNIKA